MQNLRCYFFFLSMNLLFVMLRGEWPIPDAEYDDTFEYTEYEDNPTRIEDSTAFSKDETTTLSPKEIIDTSLFTNVTAHLGYTAILPCRTKNLENADMVAWFRHKERRGRLILTVGLESYSNGRFQVVHKEGTDDWMLRINLVQKSDEGAYECRWLGKTDDGALTHHNDMVNLEVTVDTVDIIGEREIHVDQGSEISLVCVWNGLYGGVVWYHNEMLISNGEYCKVLTDIGEGKGNSQLLIQSATPSHSGNYSCTSFSGTECDTVQVFVSTDGASNLNPCLLLLMAAIPILRLVEMVSNSLYL